jgi:hypothetical protein
MDYRVKANLRYWIVGLCLSAAGVILARLLSARFAGQAGIQLALFFSGVILALAGLGIILFGMRRRGD